MKISKKDKIDNIKNNLSYGIKSRNETKKSFSERTGITRTTLYNILDGKVDRIQTQTIEKIADFFGTTCSVIEEGCLESIEYKNSLISTDGNKNPLCIPVLTEVELIDNLNGYIGELIVSYPSTYFFSEGTNIIGLKITKKIHNDYDIGSLLVIERFKRDHIDDLVILCPHAEIKIVPASYVLREQDILIGSIREERVHA
ncbi:hypothetical protein VA7868_02914 [Vibrio aerogenes CECT 7868]|uniref:HTH cro/C1-type domain-containing protein n=1 Tax=Vibrio aerogenes CECT 7868 TaxID=1216006 RepID=A0A1M5ZLX2_9VIBR|nr:helix-turn-helix transcriptional regulator [Vibrio aerogenes]SHI25230.1 hypothetical protein VA7868_02914 [Vibrio aerogenes CECT 7868]